MPEFSSRLALYLYSMMGYAFLPFAGIFLRARASRGKEDTSRLSERYGHASINRQNNVCIWVHASSLGETRAVLPLIRRLTKMRFQVVFTTVTLSAAKIAANELPKGAVHQFAPLDLKPCVSRFLKNWDPALAIFVESELWPMTMIQLQNNNIPQVFVNARISERSFQRWQRFEKVSYPLFENISLCLAQSKEDAERFADLGAESVMMAGNLKFDSDLPEVSANELAIMRGAIGERPVWFAASTHPKEEEIVAKTHLILKRHFPDLLTIISPRHPARAEQIKDQLKPLGVKVSQRSKGHVPNVGDDIYLADTIGEMSLFYQISPCSLVGGSLVPHGGQNPIEPTRLGSAVIHGPNIGNFAYIFEKLESHGGSICVKNSDELVQRVAELLSDAAKSRQINSAAKSAISTLGGALEKTHDALLPYLNPLIVAGRLANGESR